MADVDIVVFSVFLVVPLGCRGVMSELVIRVCTAGVKTGRSDGIRAGRETVPRSRDE
jgi:hypothetical protein